MSVRSAFVGAAIVLVCVGLGLGFADFGSPEHNRLLRGDAARVEAIRALATRVSLGSYGDRGNGDVPPHIANPDAVDPQTAPQPIAYSREAFGRYRVCTAFALPATDDTYDYDDDRAWYHPAGRYCYHFTAHSSTPTDWTRDQTGLRSGQRSRTLSPRLPAPASSP
jgi:hypothetical protein